jgi:mono/diheme cytochrome c family protein
MKKFRKILKWTGIIVLTILLLLAVVVALRQNRKFDAPYPQLRASGDSAVIARGKELVFGSANCDVCHSPANVDSLLALGQEPPLSGGAPHVLPFGTLYPKNLSTHPEYGIGRLSDQEIARTLRYGINADGTTTLMPGHDFTDADLTAIISYLRSQKPIDRQVPKHSFNIMGMVVKAFILKPGDLDKKAPPPLQPDTSVAWGQYLATSVSDCKGCHTQGDMLGELTGVPFAGGTPFEDPGLPPLTPPNLTQHPSGRIYGWSQQDFINRFRKGKQIAHSHMPWESFKRMSENDLKAIYNFLKSLKPSPTPAEKN